MTSFYTQEELGNLGFKRIGEKVLISRKASFYSPETIEIGNNVRIDDFSILSGNIIIGSNVHISAYAAIYGAMGVTLEDYTGLSPRSTIYSAMDDFSGEYLIGPIHDESLINVTGGPVVLKKFSQIGCNSVVFPNIIIGEGTVLGAMSMLKCNTLEWKIYAGIPAKVIKSRTITVQEKLYGKTSCKH